MDFEVLKKEVVLCFVVLVQSGQWVGLGIGSIVKYVIEELGCKLVVGELSGIVGVFISEVSEKLVCEVGILIELFDLCLLDIVIDGVDEIVFNLDFVKGLGGVLVCEKMIEVQVKWLIIIVDYIKLVIWLGEKVLLFIEIVFFGFFFIIEWLCEFLFGGCLWQFGVQFYVIDNGNYIFDVQLFVEFDVCELECCIKGMFGVVDIGLFLGMVEWVFVVVLDGVQELMC